MAKTKGYYINVRSRHPSHDEFRELLPKLPFRTVVRLGSVWEGDGKERIEINSVQAIKASADKLLMKRAFDGAELSHAQWYLAEGLAVAENLDFPVVAKHRRGSRGTGNYLLSSRE